MDDINEKLDKIMDMVAAIQIHLSAMGSGKGGSKATKEADDKLLDGPYGNFEIRIDPKSWNGPSKIGDRIADAGDEYLAAAADMYEAFGRKAEQDGKVDKSGKPCAWRDFQRAAICRGWIKRNANKAPSHSMDELAF